MKWRRLFFLLLCAMVQPLSSQIVELDSFEHLEERAGPLDEHTLLMLDVDDTLAVGGDAIWHLKAEKLRDQIIAELIANPARTFFPHGNYPAGYLHGKVFEKFEPRSILVEPITPHLVRELQNRGVKVIAFTAATGGRLGMVESVADLRHKKLKRLGFVFDNTFPEIGFLEFPQEPGKDGPPLFHGGVLFSCGHAKGEVLLHFLPEIDCYPHKVVMVDDSLSQLQSIEKALEGSGIEFVGLHYRAAEHLPYRVDEDLARFQFRHLAEMGEWLHDDEARLHFAVHE